MTNEEILSIKLDGQRQTIKGYLMELLATLWREGDSFSGKRPFGESGWQYPVYISLVKVGVLEGGFDKYDTLIDFDRKKADQMISELINSL
jgi:hypothetical protein